MNLSSEYRRQFKWRDWAAVLDSLPRLEGRTVLELGCGIGDLAAALATRGARVIGIDANEAFILEARSRKVDNAEFKTGDLRDIPEIDVEADGVWCSFTASYFPDLPSLLAGWSAHLKPGGWIALTEVDDLFGHEPLSSRTRKLLTC